VTSVITPKAAAVGAPGYLPKVPREADAVHQARLFVAAVLNTWRLDDVREGLVLIASELATDAIVHGTGSYIHVEVTRPETDRVRVAVTDESIRQPSRRNPPDDDTCGRGLFLVEALSDAWETHALTRSKTVWAGIVRRGNTPLMTRA
jgi:anti-sigma regulatory factor (Ser/Thr protein kinase)